MPRPTYDKPLEAGAVDGEVAITGPGNVQGAFTPEAALESAQELIEVAKQAEAQEPPSASP
ncbi:hypothetical protein [Phenylobacterium deserti]|uniref:Uncharacterized protein n=1 Tax=Phenylobacterium deserti TaxID=1914756 RepID=A0A328ADI2_9CAUL|nr:hypothetical protein [Phenylobacterium deserti]RAK52700.1 hypothetical protein DJ018_10920 [Phenylobacterium deserti]